MRAPKFHLRKSLVVPEAPTSVNWLCVVVIVVVVVVVVVLYWRSSFEPS